MSSPLARQRLESGATLMLRWRYPKLWIACADLPSPNVRTDFPLLTSLHQLRLRTLSAENALGCVLVIKLQQIGSYLVFNKTRSGFMIE